MIELTDIQTAIAKILTDNGYTVTANEVEQGFTKPTFFIDVLPVSVTLQNKYSELVTVSVELTYHPQLETREHIAAMSNAVKDMFLYTPIPIKDRFLSVGEILFDTDKSALVIYFELEFLQETNISEPHLPKMRSLEFNERTDNCGTSTDTD